MKLSQKFQVVLFTIVLAMSVNVLFVQSGNGQLISIHLDAIEDAIRYPLKPFINFDDIACVMQSICN